MYAIFSIQVGRPGAHTCIRHVLRLVNKHKYLCSSVG